jgi:transposase
MRQNNLDLIRCAADRNEPHYNLNANADIRRLEQISGVGPTQTLAVLAEAGHLHRFSHHRQFLKFCGRDLATPQSGQLRQLLQAVEVRQRPTAFHSRPFANP